jgi:(p)ppGpp synthase/HD superfamily hydrolase
MKTEPRIHSREFAIWAHGDQKYGDEPYVVHLDAVVGVLAEFGYTDDDSVAAGYLHDVLEDSKIVRYDDCGAFSHDVRMAMLFCQDAEGHNRKTRKAATYARCHRDIGLWQEHGGNPKDFPEPMEHIPLAVRVKVADRIANIRNCIANKPDLLQMYQKERDAFRDALYVPMMCEAMWAEYDRLLA